MKTLLTEEFAKIPEDVTVTVRSRKVTVKGPRGEVTKDFSHMACEIQLVNMNTKKNQGKHVRIRMWFGGYKQACATNTLKSLILNMLIGTTEGF
jgi:large subunit ribosomal protein L9e